MMNVPYCIATPIHPAILGCQNCVKTGFLFERNTANSYGSQALKELRPNALTYVGLIEIKRPPVTNYPSIRVILQATNLFLRELHGLEAFLLIKPVD